jgi:FtsH-binding integral membrane protein
MEQDFAVAARTRIEARNRERERRAARRDRRQRILLWLCAPLLLPAAGAAAAIAVLELEPSPRWPLFAAAFAVPLALTVWLARRRRWFEAVAWAAITAAAEVALFFWVGLVWLGYGPE